MISFLTHYTENDYLEFFKFKSYLTKSGKVNVFICLLLGAVSLFNTIQTKDYFYIGFFAIFALFMFLLWFDDNKNVPKIFVKNIKKFDSKLFSQAKFISVNQNSVEFKTAGEEENLPTLDSVYPYSVIMGIYETEKAFYLFISNSDIKIISKSGLTKEIASDISRILKTHCSNFRTINL